MCPIVGGNWNNGVNAGVWALNLNNSRGNANNNVGFRADSIPRPRTRRREGGIKGDVFRLAGTAAKSVCRRHPSSQSDRLAAVFE